VPVLEDGDLTLFGKLLARSIRVRGISLRYHQDFSIDSPLVPAESRAIARHVFRKHKPELLGGGSLERSAMVDVWLEVEAHQLHPAAGAVVVECVFAPFLGRARNQAAVDENLGKLNKVLEVYEARLSQSRYLAGDFLSVADLSHFTMMHYFMGTEYAAVVEAFPHVRAWWEELAARPAARKVAEFMPLGAGLAKKDE
jgi:glutathione S-transferase